MELDFTTWTSLVYGDEIYNSSAVAEMGNHGTAKWAEKWGLLCPFPWGELGPYLTQCHLGQGLPLYQVVS